MTAGTFLQPTNRPAFAPPPRRGSNGFGPSAVARVLPDSRAVVLARLRALGCVGGHFSKADAREVGEVGEV
jgi:hypothetical protein